MTLAAAPGVLRWRVTLPAARERVFALLTTDSGRERFWAETSRQRNQDVELSFSDGTTTILELARVDRPTSIDVRYFGTRTRFELVALTSTSTLLEVTAFEVTPDDQIDVAAGWVSVLLCLKTYLLTGVDLRNHLPQHSWREGFVDN